MIRSTRLPRPVRVGAAVAGAAGLLALAGCGGTASAAGTTAATSGSYTDGTYTADGSYQTPESVASVEVTLTLQDNTITAVTVTGSATRGDSAQFQSAFIGGIADLVVGKNIDEISVDRVAGSSLTSGRFNAAIETIKAEAQA